MYACRCLNNTCKSLLFEVFHNEIVADDFSLLKLMTLTFMFWFISKLTSSLRNLILQMVPKQFDILVF